MAGEAGHPLLPPEETIGIVPFFRVVEIQAALPPRRRSSLGNGTVNTLQNRRRAAHAEVRQDARQQKGRSAVGALDIRLRPRVDLPRYELTKDDLRFVGNDVGD